MSIDAIRLILEKPLATPDLRPSEKFILVAMAFHLNAAGESFPSQSTLSRETALDRKTVISAMKRLSDAGVIVETGRRVGATRQVAVYNIVLDGSIFIPPTRIEKPEQSASSPRPETVPETGYYPESGTVPLFPSKGPVSSTKESRFFHQRVPKTGHGTVREPSEESKRNHKHTVSAIRDEFEATFWPVVPKKVGKAGALKAYETARKKVSSETLSEAMARYRSRFIGFGGNTELQFAKHPDGWLRAERWNDEAPTTPSPEATRNPNSNQRGGGLLAAVMRSAEAGE